MLYIKEFCSENYHGTDFHAFLRVLLYFLLPQVSFSTQIRVVFIFVSTIHGTTTGQNCTVLAGTISDDWIFMPRRIFRGEYRNIPKNTTIVVFGCYCDGIRFSYDKKYNNSQRGISVSYSTFIYFVHDDCDMYMFKNCCSCFNVV